MKITLTKIKRILARLGIGSPLNILIYTKEELQDKNLFRLTKAGKIDKRRFNGWYGGRPKKYVRPYAVKLHSGIIVNKRFKDENNAKRWATWNYKGRDCFSIIHV